jgi:large subunit ribosomal protein L30
MAQKTLRIKLVKSPISSKRKQRATLVTLGLRKMHQTVDHADSPSVRGMINKVSHLVSVEELEA